MLVKGAPPLCYTKLLPHILIHLVSLFNVMYLSLFHISYIRYISCQVGITPLPLGTSSWAYALPLSRSFPFCQNLTLLFYPDPCTLHLLLRNADQYVTFNMNRRFIYTILAFYNFIWVKHSCSSGNQIHNYEILNPTCYLYRLWP